MFDLETFVFYLQLFISQTATEHIYILVTTFIIYYTLYELSDTFMVLPIAITLDAYLSFAYLIAL